MVYGKTREQCYWVHKPVNVLLPCSICNFFHSLFGDLGVSGLENG